MRKIYVVFKKNQTIEICGQIIKAFNFFLKEFLSIRNSLKLVKKY
jgi:hypothetical protein